MNQLNKLKSAIREVGSVGNIKTLIMKFIKLESYFDFAVHNEKG